MNECEPKNGVEETGRKRPKFIEVFPIAILATALIGACTPQGELPQVPTNPAQLAQQLAQQLQPN